MVFEAERREHNGNMMYCSSASDGKTVLLKQGQYVAFGFVTNDCCTISVKGVYYANDGGYDIIRVMVDEITVGRFTTDEIL